MGIDDSKGKPLFPHPTDFECEKLEDGTVIYSWEPPTATAEIPDVLIVNQNGRWYGDLSLSYDEAFGADFGHVYEGLARLSSATFGGISQPSGGPTTIDRMIEAGELDAPEPARPPAAAPPTPAVSAPDRARSL